jgi:hypothetical protein
MNYQIYLENKYILNYQIILKSLVQYKLFNLAYQ